MKCSSYSLIKESIPILDKEAAPMDGQLKE